jgi:hypothetical protein
MSTVSSADVSVARGTLLEVVGATATKPGYIVLGLPGSGYQLHLRPLPGMEAVKVEPGKKLRGVITVQARRVDIVTTGGRYIEPLYGRPRRVQGTVLANDPRANTVTVCACGAAAVDGVNLPVVLKLTDPRQKAEQFPVDALVSCDVLDGGTIEVR